MTNAELAIRLDERQRCLEAIGRERDAILRMAETTDNRAAICAVTMYAANFSLAILSMDDEAEAREIARDVKQPQRENV